MAKLYSLTDPLFERSTLRSLFEGFPAIQKALASQRDDLTWFDIQSVIDRSPKAKSEWPQATVALSAGEANSDLFPPLQVDLADPLVRQLVERTGVSYPGSIHLHQPSKAETNVRLPTLCVGGLLTGRTIISLGSVVADRIQVEGNICAVDSIHARSEDKSIQAGAVTAGRLVRCAGDLIATGQVSGTIVSARHVQAHFVVAKVVDVDSLQADRTVFASTRLIVRGRPNGPSLQSEMVRAERADLSGLIATPVISVSQQLNLDNVTADPSMQHPSWRAQDVSVANGSPGTVLPITGVGGKNCDFIDTAAINAIRIGDPIPPRPSYPSTPSTGYSMEL